MHIPKGYVYAAIGFSLLIEILNQFAARGRRKARRGAAAAPAASPTRCSSSSAACRCLPRGPGGQVFGSAERHMVGGVLSLAERRVDSIMTPRSDVAWLDLDEPDASCRSARKPHRELPVARGSLEHRSTGVVRKEDVLALCVDGKPIDLESVLRPARRSRADASVLDALNRSSGTPPSSRWSSTSKAASAGVVTRTDLLEAIAGEFPDEGE